MDKFNGIYAAAFGPACLFSLDQAVHGFQDGFPHGVRRQMTYSQAMGLTFAVVYFRTGNIRSPVLMHRLVNITAFLSMIGMEGAELSGMIL